MKISVIGGGSTYTPELVNGFITRSRSLPLEELCLIDVDPQRLSTVGGFARRMAAARNAPFTVTLTMDQREAIAGSSYVITQLRVGQMRARVADEYLGRRHGLIGQETTGIGGMAKALRTIPVLLGVADEIRRGAPDALLVNFTNPSGLVMEALTRHASDISAVGVCNVGITTAMSLLPVLEALQGGPIAPERTSLRTLGVNHLSWHRGFLLDGEETWPRLFPACLERLRGEKAPQWDASLLTELGMIPNYYLEYYYSTAKKLAEQGTWPPSRGEEVMAIEKDLLARYSDPALSEPPAALMKRGGAYYSTLAAELIESHYRDLGRVIVANTRHDGAVPGWPADWVLEMPCRVDRAGIHPLAAEPLPAPCARLVEKVKEYELMTVQAAVQGDRDAAAKALRIHPLGPEADRVRAVLDDMLETHKPFLPRFRGR